MGRIGDLIRIVGGCALALLALATLLHLGRYSAPHRMFTETQWTLQPAILVTLGLGGAMGMVARDPWPGWRSTGRLLFFLLAAAAAIRAASLIGPALAHQDVRHLNFGPAFIYGGLFGHVREVGPLPVLIFDLVLVAAGFAGCAYSLARDKARLFMLFAAMASWGVLIDWLRRSIMLDATLASTRLGVGVEPILLLWTAYGVFTPRLAAAQRSHPRRAAMPGEAALSPVRRDSDDQTP